MLDYPYANTYACTGVPFPGLAYIIGHDLLTEACDAHQWWLEPRPGPALSTMLKALCLGNRQSTRATCNASIPLQELSLLQTEQDFACP